MIEGEEEGLEDPVAHKYYIIRLRDGSYIVAEMVGVFSPKGGSEGELFSIDDPDVLPAMERDSFDPGDAFLVSFGPGHDPK